MKRSRLIGSYRRRDRPSDTCTGSANTTPLRSADNPKRCSVRGAPPSRRPSCRSSPPRSTRDRPAGSATTLPSSPVVAAYGYRSGGNGGGDTAKVGTRADTKPRARPSAVAPTATSGIHDQAARIERKTSVSRPVKESAPTAASGPRRHMRVRAVNFAMSSPSRPRALLDLRDEGYGFLRAGCTSRPYNDVTSRLRTCDGSRCPRRLPQGFRSPAGQQRIISGAVAGRQRSTTCRPRPLVTPEVSKPDPLFPDSLVACSSSSGPPPTITGAHRRPRLAHVKGHRGLVVSRPSGQTTILSRSCTRWSATIRGVTVGAARRRTSERWTTCAGTSRAVRSSRALVPAADEHTHCRGAPDRAGQSARPRWASTSCSSHSRLTAWPR